MGITDVWFKRAHEALVGGNWMLIEAGTYWQDDQPAAPGPHPNAEGYCGWKEYNNGVTVCMDSDHVHGFKFDMLRGKLEGG